VLPRTSSSSTPPTPRLALTVAEAAQSLGVSPDFFAEHVAGELRIVRRGRKKLVAVRELEAWLARSAALTLDPPGT
jgi:excisionase family DNA binding protein